MAAEIQQALMPQALRQGIGYEVAASSRPCRAIGGDFIDYFNLPDGAFAFVLGDVAGKGPAAARSQQCCRACSPRMPIAVVRPRPRCVEANDALVRRGIDSRFATAVYAVLSLMAA